MTRLKNNRPIVRNEFRAALVARQHRHAVRDRVLITAACLPAAVMLIATALGY